MDIKTLLTENVVLFEYMPEPVEKFIYDLVQYHIKYLASKGTVSPNSVLELVRIICEAASRDIEREDLVTLAKIAPYTTPCVFGPTPRKNTDFFTSLVTLIYELDEEGAGGE